ncbi:SH3 domain-binding glutamic acid-rich-like protein 3 [Plectropomus leopardus]|uniref:SH3 domain-binding glutamic acid-rich-like protein 3 n=1 Tax=Plectropomus leopardus TaxID=160734 RepID=UPI001C4BBC37|nr:SH3 domain-binding glutamic acid-rich-like protein 3 [Plectropomus leopardus]
MPVRVFLSSVSSNLEIKKHQQKIEMILSSKKISFECEDVASDEEKKSEMRRLMGNPTALPPQIFNGDVYCGDFDAFEQAVENEELEKFLKL